VNNSVRFFMRESGKVRCDVDESFSSEAKLYNAYFAFACGAGGFKPVGQPRFRAMMRELAPELRFELKIGQTSFGGTEAIYNRVALIA
jgi:hypothetical protein